MVHHHFFPSHPRNQHRSLLNKQFYVKSRLRPLGIVAGRGAVHLFAFCHNDKLVPPLIHIHERHFAFACRRQLP